MYDIEWDRVNVLFMPENPLLQWTVDAKRALQQAEQLSSHASALVSQSADSLNSAIDLFPKCIFLKDALKGQIALLEKLGGRCYAVEEQARREFEVARAHPRRSLMFRCL